MGCSEVVYAHCQAEDALVRTSFLLTGTRLTGSRYRVRLITMRGQSKTPCKTALIYAGIRPVLDTEDND
jgi:hypothetical protein